MSVNLTGFDALMKSISESPDRLRRNLVVKARKLAEQVAGQARNGAPVKTGRLRNSIEGYTEVQGDIIEGGARTNYLPAIYHEFGTGPVGDANPHPMDGELGVSRRPDGWTYWSDEAAANREPGTDGEPNGWVYTEGVPAKAFLYNALKANEDEIMASLGASVTEVFQ